MKNYKLVTLFIVMGLSLPTQSKGLADPEDLKIFNDTNYCQGCELSGVSIYEDHDNGFLINSYAIQTEFLGSFYKMNFSGSVMNNATFRKFPQPLKVQESNFDKVNLSHSKFDRVDLSRANFSDVNLSNSKLDGVNLSEVNFTNANLTNVTMENSILIGSNLTKEQLAQFKSIKCTVMPNGELNHRGC
ncbi:TPA: pentapeptide repeat-containing protein [Legionella pneumophila]|nr:pentapeptide repeat-containing protein [Legionella pneumophila]HEL9659466.1 pentapeptide repeat-containing protein [Legionella pneumophila]